MNIESDRGKKLKVLAADSHWIARSALAKLLQGLEQELQTLEAANLDDALELAKAHADLDLILIDPVMPGMSGLEGLQAMRKTAAAVPIIVISVSEERDDALRCINVGAMGYIPKTADGDEILTSINMVLSGYAALPRRILEKPVSRMHAKDSVLSHRSAPSISKARLTQRQAQIFELLGEGLSNPEIASRLDLSVNTVRVHVHGILQRLQLDNRMQVVMHAVAQREGSRGSSQNLA